MKATGWAGKGTTGPDASPNLARDADMVHRRRVTVPGQGDVAGNARALLADGLLGDLDRVFPGPP